MERKMQPLLVAGLTASGFLIAFPQGFAALPSGAGYIHDSSGTVVRGSDGDCVRTSRWSPETATAQCDSELVQHAATAAPSEPVDAATSEIAAIEPRREEINLAEKALFDFDRAELKAEDKRRLDEVVAQIGNIPEDAAIRITGHTDSIGSEEYNLNLSMRRAEAAQEYLVNKGIDRKRIVIAGMGASNPVASNATAEGRAINRRAEIEIQAG